MWGSVAGLEAATGELHQVRTQTEPCALAGRQAHRGAQQVQDGKHQGRHHGDTDNLLQARNAAGDDHHRYGHSQTLQQILDNARNQLSDRQVHLFLLGPAGFFTQTI